MRHLLPMAALSACLCTLAWSMIAQPEPQDDLQALQQCMQFHPERYCRLTYAPSTIADKQR